MSENMNCVILTGRLTKDIEFRKTQSGMNFANYTIACNRRKSSKEDRAKVDFLDIVSWRGDADYLQKCNVKKGTLLSIRGSLQKRTYERSDGTKAYVVEVVTDFIELLSSPNKGNARIQETRETEMMPDPLDLFNREVEQNW